MKSLINRSELLLHVTIAPQCKSLTSTPTCAPGDTPAQTHTPVHTCADVQPPACLPDLTALLCFLAYSLQIGIRR